MSANGIKASSKNAEAICKLFSPQKSLGFTFLDMIAYFKFFVPKYNALDSPLSALVGKENNFNWTPIFDYNSRALKEKPVRPPSYSTPCMTVIIR